MESIHLLPAIIISAIVAIFGKYSENKTAFYIFKPLTTMLIIFMTIMNASVVNVNYKYFILAAMFASLLGDYLLMMPGDGKFLQGLIAFLLAHVIYSGAFYYGSNSFSLILIIPFAVYGIVYIFFIKKNLGRFYYPVILYVAVISLMGFLSLNLFENSNDGIKIYAFVGALLFILSDSILGYNRFVKKFFVAEIFILSTYYSAQVLIAMSV